MLYFIFIELVLFLLEDHIWATLVRLYVTQWTEYLEYSEDLDVSVEDAVQVHNPV